MYKDLKRTCTAIVLLIKPFVYWRSRYRRRCGLLKLPIDVKMTNPVLSKGREPRRLVF